MEFGLSLAAAIQGCVRMSSDQLLVILPDRPEQELGAKVAGGGWRVGVVAGRKRISSVYTG